MRWLGIAALCLSSCKPAEEGRPSLLEEPRILAIQALPAESAPGELITFNLLRAGAAGPLDVDSVDMAYCIRRKPLAAPGIIAPACLTAGEVDGEDGSATVPIANAQPWMAAVPKDACSVFGPSQPVTTPGQPALRPVDPDTTGGYYQPVRVSDGTRDSIGFVRLMCGLSGTTQDNNIAWKKRYIANANPSIARVVYARSDAALITLESSEVAEFAPGEHVQFAVTWPKCSVDEQRCGDGVCGRNEDATTCPEDCTKPESCDGAETYTLLDPAANQLRTARETIRVSWYISGGSLERDRSGRLSNELERDAQNQWNAPKEAGDYWLIAVIRDDRGGVGWTTRLLRVVP
jgi:hypothetical protein